MDRNTYTSTLHLLQGCWEGRLPRRNWPYAGRDSRATLPCCAAALFRRSGMVKVLHRRAGEAAAFEYSRETPGKKCILLVRLSRNWGGVVCRLGATRWRLVRASPNLGHPIPPDRLGGPPGATNLHRPPPALFLESSGNNLVQDLREH